LGKNTHPVAARVRAMMRGKSKRFMKEKEHGN